MTPSSFRPVFDFSARKLAEVQQDFDNMVAALRAAKAPPRPVEPPPPLKLPEIQEVRAVLGGYGTEFAEEPYIKHNWVTGASDVFGYLDAETRHQLEHVIGDNEETLEDIADQCPSLLWAP